MKDNTNILQSWEAYVELTDIALKHDMTTAVAWLLACAIDDDEAHELGGEG